MMTATTTTYAPITLPEPTAGGVPEGTYKLSFQGYEPVPANLEKGYKAGVKFLFAVREGEHKGRVVPRTVGLANAANANLPKWLKMLTKTEPKPGSINLNPYVGKPYIGQVMKTDTAASPRLETVIAEW